MAGQSRSPDDDKGVGAASGKEGAVAGIGAAVDGIRMALEILNQIAIGRFVDLVGAKRREKVSKSSR